MEEQPGHQIVPVTDDGKTVALVSYLTFIGWVIALILHGNNKTHLGSFHLRQALFLHLMWVAGWFIFPIPFLGWLVGPIIIFGAFVLWIISFIGAANGEEKKAPLIGDSAQNMFANAFN